MIYLKALWSNKLALFLVFLIVILAVTIYTLIERGESDSVNISLFICVVAILTFFVHQLVVWTLESYKESYKEIRNGGKGVTARLRRRWTRRKWGPCPKAGFRLAVQRWERQQKRAKRYET